MKVENLLPEVYYKESRDFAYIGRLIELCLNYMKTGADCVGIGLNDPNIQSVMINLLINTLGFEARHTYLLQDIIYVASAFIEMLRNKGTKKSIDMAIRLLLNAQGIENPLDMDFVRYDTDENQQIKESTIRIFVPNALTDIVLLEDIFDYILPVGVTYVLTFFDTDVHQYKTDTSIYTDLNPENTSLVSIQQAPNKTLSQIRAMKEPNEQSEKYKDYTRLVNLGIGTIYTGVTDNADVSYTVEQKQNALMYEDNKVGGDDSSD